MGEVLNEQFGRTVLPIGESHNCFEIPPLGGIFLFANVASSLFGLNAATTSGAVSTYGPSATECSTVRWQKYRVPQRYPHVLHTFQRLFNRLRLTG